MGRKTVKTLIAEALEIKPVQVAKRLNDELKGVANIKDAVAKVMAITEKKVNVSAVALRNCLRSGMAKRHGNSQRLCSIGKGRPRTAVAE